MTDNTCTDCLDQAPTTPASKISSTDLQAVSKAYDPLDASTFKPPPPLPVPSVTIEFCDRVSTLITLLRRKKLISIYLLVPMVSLQVVNLETFTLPLQPLCRLHRATWVSTELLLTFPPPALNGVHIIPLNSEDTAGRFRVWLSTENGLVLAWDRKIKGGFPELKELVRYP